jgi:hypothetical protein
MDLPSPQPRSRHDSKKTSQAQLNPLFFSGSVLTRFPVAAKIAFVTAGRIGGSVGSPSPVGA